MLALTDAGVLIGATRLLHLARACSAVCFAWSSSVPTLRLTLPHRNGATIVHT
jgi:hypothetical protein